MINLKKFRFFYFKNNSFSTKNTMTITKKIFITTDVFIFKDMHAIPEYE